MINSINYPRTESYAMFSQHNQKNMLFYISNPFTFLTSIVAQNILILFIHSHIHDTNPHPVVWRRKHHKYPIRESSTNKVRRKKNSNELSTIFAQRNFIEFDVFCFFLLKFYQLLFTLHNGSSIRFLTLNCIIPS